MVREPAVTDAAAIAYASKYEVNFVVASTNSFGRVVQAWPQAERLFSTGGFALFQLPATNGSPPAHRSGRGSF